MIVKVNYMVAFVNKIQQKHTSHPHLLVEPEGNRC
jgi:hypothetical protein